MAANRSSSRNLTRRIIANTTDTYRSAWANSQYDPVKLFGEGASTHMDILCRWVLNQKPNDKVDRDMLMSLKSMVRAYADWTPDLLRFSDRRHAKFQGVPDANGNNIQQNLSQDELGGLSLYGSETLSKMFRYYADDWLRMLHYKELCPCWYDQHRQPVSVEIRATELEETLVAKAKDLASLEKEKYNLNKEIDKRYEIEDITLHWTNELRRSCVEGIRAMAAADMWAYERHMDRLKAVYDAYTTVPRISRVMVMCLSAHADFEHRLRFLHVEDESIRKRIFICAWDTKKKLIESGQHAFLSHLESKHWPKADDAARYIGAELSNLFDYRLIRDWGFGRPWAGLELYIDAGFHKLNDIITRIRNITSGSSKDLLAVKPVDMYDIIRMQDRSCDICTTDFKDLEVVMR
ncbi:MAG: hypothetical protein M1834_008260 [Cirrosporium novae-zelandiae]|nr:MAG: hypothetical protein M1834_008260 [Cirrosporium novae-zelandiae]